MEFYAGLDVSFSITWKREIWSSPKLLAASFLED